MSDQQRKPLSNWPRSIGLELLNRFLPDWMRVSESEMQPKSPPGLLAPPGSMARWLGGRGRRGYQSPFKRALISMVTEMGDRSTSAVLGELEADALGRESALTGVREAGETDLEIARIDSKRVHYVIDGRQKSLSLRRLDNILSEVRKSKA